MHSTAIKNADLFFQKYTNKHKINSIVVDIGSQNVNGSLREICPKNMKYIGVDFSSGNGVDIVLDDPYELPFDNGQVDYCICSSVFEHSEMFWLLFLEILRILKPDGLFYLNVPSNGHFHRYPVDCWRFYPDSGKALVKWAKKCGFNPILLESFVSLQEPPHKWNDFVAIFLKNADYAANYNQRITGSFKNFYNALTFESEKFINFTQLTEDQAKIDMFHRIIEGELVIKWY
ncbi:type 11 methyltransferase [Candidatus Magnetomorum sp. HK-1]|nr:type 11 methyltransferase [Candidatus Magnetomorum sp. HK-1]